MSGNMEIWTLRDMEEELSCSYVDALPHQIHSPGSLSILEVAFPLILVIVWEATMGFRERA